MKISDLLVIYFSCGAPFAVYFYFERRARLDTTKLWFETICAFLFWIPSSMRLLLKIRASRKKHFREFAESNSPRAERARNLFRLQKRLEVFSRGVVCPRTVFEIRETLERYAGLTLALEDTESDCKIKPDFFIAAKNKNATLAAKCFERRNRKRLSFHQSSARRDFLRFVSSLLPDSPNAGAALGKSALEFAKILNDGEAQKAIEEMFFAERRKGKISLNENAKLDLWKPKTPSAKQTQTPITFRSMSPDPSPQITTTHLRKKE